jgi:hypothetical protein
VRIGAIVRTAMRFRLELFVEDLDTSVAFYERALGFRVARREPEYASLRRGDAELGLAPITKLPVGGAGPGFTQDEWPVIEARAWRSCWRWRTLRLPQTLWSEPASGSSSHRASVRGAFGTSAWPIRTGTTCA